MESSANAISSTPTSPEAEPNAEPDAEPTPPPRDLQEENLDLLSPAQGELFSDEDLGQGPLLLEQQGEMFNEEDLGPLTLGPQDQVPGDPRQPSGTVQQEGQVDLFDAGQTNARNLQGMDAQQQAARNEPILPYADVDSSNRFEDQQALERDMSVLENEIAAPPPRAEVQREFDLVPPTPTIIMPNPTQGAPVNADPLQADIFEPSQAIAPPQQVAPAPAPQRQLPPGQLDMFDQQTMDRMGPAQGDLFSRGEPTVNIPHEVRETGEVVMRPVPVREAMEEAQQRIDALEEYQACRGWAK